MNNVAINIHPQGFVETHAFDSLGEIPKSRIARSSLSPFSILQSALSWQSWGPGVRVPLRAEVS